jgi:hypothetical protein
VARLPFAPQACGSGLAVLDGCRISEDGRRWLLPVSAPVEGGDAEDRRASLTLFEVPLPPLAR